MLHSDNYQQSIITINGKQFEIEFDLQKVDNVPNSVRVFGNLYIDPNDPMEFTFFTINGKIAGYTPMNGTKEFISNLVSTILGQVLPFE